MRGRVATEGGDGRAGVKTRYPIEPQFAELRDLVGREKPTFVDLAWRVPLTLLAGSLTNAETRVAGSRSCWPRFRRPHCFSRETIMLSRSTPGFPAAAKPVIATETVS